MNSTSQIQQDIFNRVKEILPDNISLVHEVANALQVSTDSAYRRIRGEKPLTLEELASLNSRFNISVDEILNPYSANVTFNSTHLHPEKFVVSDWLDKIYNDLRKIHALKGCELIYAAKDPPIYQYFHLPEIAAFKVFFWEKTLFRFPNHETHKFSLKDFSESTYKRGFDSLTIASKTPITEIWNKDTFRMLLNQIEYYWISGLFDSKDDLLNLLDKAEKWIKHIQRQAEYGFLFKSGEEPEGLPDYFKMYCNEVVLNDNTILVKHDKGLFSYITFNVLSLLQTNNQPFCNEIKNHFNGLIRISNLISQSGEKERNRFFNEQLNAILKFRQSI
ncbi:hypothetical protein [Saccharicrinis sp. FJH54]|uniref:hypothetical protein n=1 Tax=Saccharicrinis sp. FJH54 TaxID=3344665 RepID=UPI0035D4D38C